jgi:hypothetical protein
MGGDEVDARVRFAAVVLVQVGAAGEPRREFPKRLVLAAPVVPHRIPVFAVPLAPEHREIADLVAALAHVPRLRDQLHAVENRILVDDVEECREPVDVVELARQRGREIEAEAVHVHLGDPVAQRVRHQLQRVGMPHVQAVPGAGVVHVVPPVVVHRAVVGGIVESLERQHRAEMIPLRRVVVDDVEDDFDSGGVHRLHELLELADLPARVAGAAVIVVRREEADGVVAPVVPQPAVEQEAVVHELMDRQQFDRRDSEAPEVLDRRGMREPRIRAPQRLRHVGAAGGEPLHVDFVDDRPVERAPDRRVSFPVEARVDHDRARHVRRAVVLAHRVAFRPLHVRQDGRARRHVTRDGERVRVDQELCRVAAVAVPGRPWSVHAVAVRLPRPDTGQVRMPAEGGDLRQVDTPLRAARIEEAEFDARRHL